MTGNIERKVGNGSDFISKEEIRDGSWMYIPSKENPGKAKSFTLRSGYILWFLGNSGKYPITDGSSQISVVMNRHIGPKRTISHIHYGYNIR